jgi:hypothetical protein
VQLPTWHGPPTDDFRKQWRVRTGAYSTTLTFTLSTTNP